MQEILPVYLRNRCSGALRRLSQSMLCTAVPVILPWSLAWQVLCRSQQCR